ncbi:hypothetical protein LBMAG27_21610 [Bacteroidota bacterium]|nr:hypothetical protein LBMAG27_21610 [Bacteroidota bacterium]
MGRRKIIIRESVVENIAEVAWFIESKGLIKTADKFSDAVYDFIEKLSDERIIHALCIEPERKSFGLKCKSFRKYTIVFIESDTEITVTEFISSKMIQW